MHIYITCIDVIYIPYMYIWNKKGKKNIFDLHKHTHKYNNIYMRKITHDNYSLHFYYWVCDCV